LALLYWRLPFQSAQSTVPTRQDPNSIDQAWQKASSKYDTERTALLKQVDDVVIRAVSADWESFKYEVPAWYEDAVRRYIHWGVYSVPAFSNGWYRNM
jgi:hypothetical protein